METIPAERVEKLLRRARRTLGWARASMFPILGFSCLWMLFFPGALAWLMFVPLIGWIAGFLWMISRCFIKCPNCGRTIEHLAFLKRTKRCIECRCVVMTGDVAEDLAKERRKSRNAYIRIGVYLIILGIAAPFGFQWLEKQQLLPANRGVWGMTLGIWALLSLIGVALGFALWSGKLRKERIAEDLPMPAPYPALKVMKPSRWSARTYRIYFAPQKLCFGHIGGSIYDENSPITRGQGGIFMMPLVEKELRRMRRLEAVYDTIDPASEDLLKIDRANFQIERAKIESMDYVPMNKLGWKQRIGFPRAAGVLTLKVNDQTAIRLGVIDNLSAPEVEAFLRQWESEERMMPL